MEKLKKTAHILSRIVRVLRGMCLGFGIAAAILMIIALFLPGNQFHLLVRSADTSISLGNVRLHLSSALEPNQSLRWSVCALLLLVTVGLGMSACGLHLLHKILLPMSEGQPFNGSVSTDLKKLGWFSLAAVLSYTVFDAIGETLAITIFDLDQIFTSDLVTEYTVSHTINLSLLLIPVLLFILSYVFQYGEELQQQSDETL